MYKTLKELLEKAEKFNYTVGSFNMHNLEMLPPMIMAAKDMGAPDHYSDKCGNSRIYRIWGHRRGMQASCRTRERGCCTPFGSCDKVQ